MSWTLFSELTSRTRFEDRNHSTTGIVYSSNVLSRFFITSSLSSDRWLVFARSCSLLSIVCYEHCKYIMKGVATFWPIIQFHFPRFSIFLGNPSIKKPLPPDLPPPLAMALCSSPTVIQLGTILPLRITDYISSPCCEPGDALSSRNSQPAERCLQCRCVLISQLWVPLPEHGPPRMNTTVGGHMEVLVLKLRRIVSLCIDIVIFSFGIDCYAYVSLCYRYYNIYSQTLKQMPQLQLTQLLGNSSSKSQQLAYAQQCLIYTCGSYLIFYNPTIDEQLCYLQHQSPFITYIAVSPSEQFVAVCSSTTGIGKGDGETTVGEAVGKKNLSAIYVYNINDLGVRQPALVGTLNGHKYPIDHAVFSPDQQYLVSISNSDRSMFSWDWRRDERTTQNRNSKNIITDVKFLPALSIDSTTYFATISRGNCKIWQFMVNGVLCRTKEQEHWILSGRNINLPNKLSTKQFISLSFWQSYLLLLTSDGLLCLILRNQTSQKLQKCVDLMMANVCSMDVYMGTVMCAGENSVVKVVQLKGLSLVSRFPKPPPSLKENIQKDSEINNYEEIHENQNFPQCTCIKTLNSTNNSVTYFATIYENMTIFIWRPEGTEIVAMRSVISHRGPIQTLRIIEQLDGNLTFFSSAGSDGTVRIWHIYTRNTRTSIDLAQHFNLKRNAYCRNLTRILYLQSQSPQQVQVCGVDTRYLAVLVAGLDLFVYSLAGFEVVAYEGLEEQAVGIQGWGTDILLPGRAGKLTVWGLADGRLVRKRDVEFGVRVKGLAVVGADRNSGGCIVVHSQTNQLHLYSPQTQTHKILPNIQKFCKHNKSILIYTDGRLGVYSIQKQKQTYLLTVKQELGEKEQIKIMKCNEAWIVLVTDQNRIIVCNFSPAILCTSAVLENINQIEISSSGQLIAVGDFGNVCVWQIHGLISGRSPVEVQKWMARDMSWMDRSVWANKQPKSKADSSQQYKLPIAESIQLTGKNISSSIRVEVPDINIEYKNTRQDQSIFNPSDIVKQAKEIYRNINHVIERKTNNNSNVNEGNKGKHEETNDKGPNEYGLEEIELAKNPTASRPSQSKKRIFGLKLAQRGKEDSRELSFDDKEIQNQADDAGIRDKPLLSNNLVNSIIQISPPQAPSNDSLLISYSQFKEQAPTLNILSPKNQHLGGLGPPPSIPPLPPRQNSQTLVNDNFTGYSQFESVHESEEGERNGIARLVYKLHGEQYVRRYRQDLLELYRVLKDVVGQQEKQYPKQQQGKEQVKQQSKQQTKQVKGAKEKEKPRKDLDSEKVVKEFSRMSEEFLKFLKNGAKK